MKHMPSSAFGAKGDRGHGKRRAERASVLMPASIVTMTAYQFPELLNISRTGAKLRGDPLPAKGATALFRVGKVHLLCRVVWRSDVQCGIRFEEPLPERALKQITLDGAISIESLSPAERLALDDWADGKAD